jgi:hypothetical protein
VELISTPHLNAYLACFKVNLPLLTYLEQEGQQAEGSSQIQVCYMENKDLE